MTNTFSCCGDSPSGIMVGMPGMYVFDPSSVHRDRLRFALHCYITSSSQLFNHKFHNIQYDTVSFSINESLNGKERVQFRSSKYMNHTHLSSLVSPSRLGGLLLSIHTGIVRVAAGNINIHKLYLIVSWIRNLTRWYISPLVFNLPSSILNRGNSPGILGRSRLEVSPAPPIILTWKFLNKVVRNCR